MTSPYKGQVRYSLGGPLSPVVKQLIIINVAAYFLVAFSQVPHDVVWELLGLKPSLVTQQRALWQPLTYMFLHDLGLLHILINMLVLWWFGSDIERIWGGRLFLRYYLMSGVFAGLCVIGTDTGSDTVTIGSSGAIMAIMLAYAMTYPNRTILFMFVIPMKAKYFVMLIAALEILLPLMGNSENISHTAHLGGLAFGVLWFLYYSRRLNINAVRRFFRKRRMRSRLRVVRRGDDEADSDNEQSTPTIH